ncbi:hypothetical protein ACFWIQ_28190 [Kitasatospora sp. NPDC127059]|uniref:hypothetical protein n=1 Tax=unclassified Kitasatospora TaxID=2633591 RepID=UPI00365A5B41
MGRPNDTIRRVREVEWEKSRTEAATFLVEQSIEAGEPLYLVARTIATWEDGKTAWPRAKYRRLLHRVTGRTATELGFTQPTYRGRSLSPGTETTKGSDEDVHRRSLLLGLGAAVLTTTVPQGTGAGPVPGAGPALGRDHVQALRQAEQALYEQDRDRGSSDLAGQATAILDTAQTWLTEGRYDDGLGRELHTATGMLSVAAGWLALDAGRTKDARSRYTEALASARHADDPGLEAHAFACLSLLAHTTGRPREAVGTAQVAQRAAAGLGSPRWLALLAMREARGWALQGDRALTEQALVRAYDLYAKGPREADPGWLEFFVPAEVAGLESLCRADLGQFDRACAGAEQTLMLFAGGHARNAALYTADIALHQAHRERPDLDAAVDAGHRTLAYLKDVRSERLTAAVHGIATALQPHRTVPCVAEYLDAYRTAVAA